MKKCTRNRLVAGLVAASLPAFPTIVDASILELIKIPGSSEEERAPVPVEANYAINLSSVPGELDTRRIGYSPLFEKFRLYSQSIEIKGKPYTRIRLGFFSSKEEAKKVHRELMAAFPASWVTSIRSYEREQSAGTTITIPSSQLARIVAPTTIVNTPTSVRPKRKVAPKKVEPRMAGADSATISSGYVLTLLSTGSRAAGERELQRVVERGFDGYLTSFSKGGRHWTRVRVGIFTDRSSASKVQEALKGVYPGSWLAKAGKGDFTAYAAAYPQQTVAVAAKEDESHPVEATAPAVSRPPLSSEAKSRTERYLERVRHEMTARNYDQAIQIATALLELPDDQLDLESEQQGLEMLGLARERKGQRAHAAKVYEEYLTLYPKSDGATRVQQRLAGLMTATQDLKKRQATTKRKRARTAQVQEWRHYGSFSQYYYRSHRTDEQESDVVDLDRLISSVNLTSRKKGEESDHRIQIAADNSHDFIGNAGKDRITRFYYQWLDRQSRHNMTIGRQTYSQGGVLGRFDGINGGLALSKRWKANLVGGYLLDSENLFDLERDKNFYSANIAVDGVAKNWDFNLYGMQQSVADLVDRQAVGVETRYFDPAKNMFSLVDYDTHFNELNIFFLNMNWNTPARDTVFLSVDHRRSPTLNLSNSLIGQTVTDMDEMKLIYTEEELKQLALDRSPMTSSLAVGGSHPLTSSTSGRQFQISGDLTVARTDGAPASGGVAEMEFAGNSYFVGTQLTGNNIVRRGDVANVSLRGGSNRLNSTYIFDMSGRYPFARDWRFSPRFQFNYRDERDSEDNRATSSLGLKLEYRYKRMANFEAEVEFERATETNAGITDKSSTTFFTLGYRLDF